MNATPYPADVAEAIEWLLPDPADREGDFDEVLIRAGRRTKEIRRLNAMHGGTVFDFHHDHRGCADDHEGHPWRKVEEDMDLSSRTMRRWGEDPPFAV